METIGRNSSKTIEIITNNETMWIREIKLKNDGADFDQKYTFEAEADMIKKSGILVPRYYWNSKKEEIKKDAEEDGIELVSIQQLIDEGIIKFFKGDVQHIFCR